jgi:hypothetical protein
MNNEMENNNYYYLQHKYNILDIRCNILENKYNTLENNCDNINSNYNKLKCDKLRNGLNSYFNYILLFGMLSLLKIFAHKTK